MRAHSVTNTYKNHSKSFKKAEAKTKASISSIKDLEAIKKNNSKVLKHNSHKRMSSYIHTILNALIQKSVDLGDNFLEKFQSKLSNSDNIKLKHAAHSALNELVVSAKISIEEVRKITHLAWLTVFKSNESKHNFTTRSLSFLKDSTINSTEVNPNKNTYYIDAPKGFLWKPISDSPPHGLAVLLPPEWTDQARALIIIDPVGGKVLAEGRDAGVGNGGRQHYRFNRQGGDFPDSSIVRVLLRDGTVRDIIIKDSSRRLEGK